jgi:hypothetical protein
MYGSGPFASTRTIDMQMAIAYFRGTLDGGSWFKNIRINLKEFEVK